MNKKIIASKLRLDKASRIFIFNATLDFENILPKGKYDTKPSPAISGTYDYVQLFATSQTELESLLMRFHMVGEFDCVFWVCYPKGTADIKSDIKRGTVWEAFHLVGMEAVSQVAIDDTWSAMRGRPKERVGK